SSGGGAAARLERRRGIAGQQRPPPVPVGGHLRLDRQGRRPPAGGRRFQNALRQDGFSPRLGTIQQRLLRGRAWGGATLPAPTGRPCESTTSSPARAGAAATAGSAPRWSRSTAR